MWLNECSTYKYINNESVKNSEEHLQTELNELKREIETNELVHGISFVRPFSSVPIPKDGQILAKERRLYIEKMLQVHDIRKPYIQADIINEQITNSNKDEYKAESLPILLNQFFLDKISWCIQAKHSHMLRWKRFSEHTHIIEEMYSHFKNRIGYILSDYNDSIKRSQRLNQARELLLNTNSCSQALSSIELEDIEIYMRWLICHFYSQKSFNQAIKLLEWLPYQISFDSYSSNATLNNKTSLSIITNSSRDLNQIKSELIKNNNSMNSLIDYRFKSLDNIYFPNPNSLLPRDEILNTLSYTFNNNVMPVHNNSIEYLLPRLRFLVNFYKIDYNLSRMQTSGDEMELFAAVNRKFRHIFAQQEHMKAFKVYDHIENGNEHWGIDSPIHALKKEANWLEFIQLLPTKDSIYEKDITKLKQKNFIDQFLLSHNSFLEINNDERVQEALRENSTLIKNPQNVEAISVTTNPTQFNTNSLWKKVFHNPNLSNKDQNLDTINKSGSASTTTTTQKLISFRSKTSKKQDEFSFVENLQKLGLDDSKTNDQNLTNVQGSYLSFLLLRHLRIRDLKRQALGFLNYFRSIEKTITIYDGGLSLESSSFKRQSTQNHMKETPYGTNLGYHAYIYNSPKDFRISETEFIEFSEIENHDDFYSLDEKGFVHVQDQRGYYIIYDIALNDIKKLENELLLIASYYIAKDKETYTANNVDNIRRKKDNSVQDINLEYYSHQNVDRFAVLLDIWTNEVNFLEMKKNLMDIYYEVYQNVFDKNEKRNLAQIMTNIMYQRVRFDLHADYFSQTYRMEVSCLYKQVRIAKLILDKMIDDMRNLLDKVEDSKYGLPYSVIKKSQINLSSNSNGSTLKNFYLLEFHPCLASASRLPNALKQSIEELVYFKSIQTVTDRLSLEEKFFSLYLDQLERLEPICNSFTAQIQREVFNGIYIEDPLLMTDYLKSSLKQLEEQNKHKTKKDQADAAFKLQSNILEMITLRHRLINASLETEVLSKLYKKLATELGFEEFHMYLRYVQFDFAKFKENAGNQPPVFVSEINGDDSQIDRYVPNNLYLTIHEMEEGQIGRLSFKGKENVQNVLRPGGIENLQLILKLQVVHNNALITSLMQAHSCLLSVNLAPRTNKDKLITITTDKTDENIFMKQISNNSDQVESKIILNQNKQFSRLKKLSESFVSIQLEKNPYRDQMLNDYIKQKETKGLMLSNPLEMEKLKRNLMNEYANKFSERVLQYSLRAQLITLYYSITKILENFPNTRDNHFVFGEPNEKRNLINSRSIDLNESKKQVITDETIDYIKPDARQFKKRPRKLLSDDGERVLNLWFIPHYTDLLIIYKKNFNTETTLKALNYSVRIMTAFNDILNFLYANACMNIAVNSSAATDSSTAQLRKKVDFSSWENSGGLDTELNEIQLEMNQLNDPCDPEQVAQLLELKRSSMMLQYDCAIRFAVKDIFLANGNNEAYKIINENIQHSLKFFNDYMYDTTENVYLNLPEPFDPRDSISSQIFPWRSFISRNGSFPLKYQAWYLIEPNVTMCITGLRDIDKNVANGEILGVTLMMEDLLNSDSLNESDLIEPSSQLNLESLNQQSRKSITQQPDTFGIQNNTKKNAYLIDNYNRWRFFLLTWKRLELLKLDWGRKKLGVENINNSDLYAKFCETYKKEVLVPVLKILIKKSDLNSTKPMHENIVDFNQPVILPADVSELESKIKQIIRLLEKLELNMIDETVQRAQKEVKLVLSERARDENSLTTDLWKKSIMKEEFTINKPHIANEFTEMFFALSQSFEEKSENKSKVFYKISEQDIKNSLIRLGSLIQERERSNFEQYTMFYENILRQQHQLLYSREREIKSLKSLIEMKTNEVNVEVQCNMADACYDLIMEVTALRAKLAEITESKENLEKDLRHKVKKEFIDLVTDLVNVNTSLKSQLDLYKENIHADVLEILSECKNDAFDQIAELKTKHRIQVDELETRNRLNKEDLIRQLQKERRELNILLIIQKSYSKIKENKNSSLFNKKLSEITEISNIIKRKEIDNCLITDQKQLLINQQKMALKKQLAKLDSEFNNLKIKLEKELKEKQNKEHELQQKMKNERNLNSAKKSNVEKLFEELESKDIELRNLHMVNEKTSKMQSINGPKIQKEIHQLKKNLFQERNLKLDAFQKVDELQTHVYDLEEEIVNIIQSRPQTTLSNYKGNRINLLSSMSNSNQQKHSSPFPKLNSNLPTPRPKTTVDKYKIDEIEENEKDPNSNQYYHETILKLREFRMKLAKS